MPLDRAAAGIGPYIKLTGVNNTLYHCERINCNAVPDLSSSLTLWCMGLQAHT